MPTKLFHLMPTKTKVMEDEKKEKSDDSVQVDTEELVLFREQWRAELCSRQEIDRHRLKSTPLQQKITEAEELYWNGVAAEQNGDMSSAILYYRQAIQMVPDIESKITRPRIPTGTNVDSEIKEDRDKEIDTITEHVSNLNFDVNESSLICKANQKIEGFHISALPLEILQYIVCLMVLPDLDLRTLEQFGMVCKGFYMLARENLLWQKSCQRLWGKECNPVEYSGDWRLLYISCPHVHFNGVYISRSSYVRPGERSLDLLYKPFHTVIYYRYLRFFADGSVLYLTSPEEPAEVVGRLRHKVHTDAIMLGHFTLSSNMLNVVATRSVKVTTPSPTSARGRRRRVQSENSTQDQKFHMEMELNHSKAKLSSQLKWKHFSCHTVHRLTGQLQVSEFNIDYSYTPFYFSRVKSYSIIH